MADFQSHLSQAKSNLQFLEAVNDHSPSIYWDWKVTISFYSAVHFVCAHIVKLGGSNYRTHEQVKEALNPARTLSATKLPEEEYKAYVKLLVLSRRARYLCNENGDPHPSSGYLTYDKHLSKAIKHLDTLISYLSNRHGFELEKVKLNCVEIKSKNCKYFEHAA